MAAENQSLLSEFLAECFEHLEGIESLILQIEHAGEIGDEKLLHQVFRAAHSIKGSSAMLGYKNVQQLAHGLESILGQVRAKTLKLTSERTDVLFQGFDLLRDLLNNIAKSEFYDIAPMVSALESAATSIAKAPTVASPPLQTISRTQLTSHFAELSLSEAEVREMATREKFIYLLRFDLIRNVDAEGKSLMTLVQLISGFGTILDATLDFMSQDPDENVTLKNLPFCAAFVSTLPPHEIPELLELPPDCFRVLHLDAPTSQADAASVADVALFAARPAAASAPISAVGAPAFAGESHTPKTAGIALADPGLRSVLSAPDLPGATLAPMDPAVAPSACSASSAVGGSDPLPAPATPVVEAAARSSATLPVVPVFPEGSRAPTVQAPVSATEASSAPEATIRVKVELLERLMNLAGELVLSRNQLREALSQSDMSAIRVSGKRIHSVTSELQEAIMATRLQSIDRIFSKMPRVVRESSRDLGKTVNLRLEGNEVELDKSLIEGLSDPLTHMIRNSIDHGIETDEERARLGKSVPAIVFLTARHEAGQVVLEVGDDGRGIDLEKVTQKALALGLTQEERATRLTEKEKLAFIFSPGFSTATTVTSLSGRGVGMDVVKTNIDRLGGQIEIETKSGKGSLFRLRLPLTLAIIPSLIVAVQKDLFAIPQRNVIELLRIPPEQVKRRIELVGGQEVLMQRGALLPLIDLAAYLEVPKCFVDPRSGAELDDRRSRLADRRSIHGAAAVEHRRPSTGFALEDAAPPELPERSEGRRFRSAGDLNIVVVSTGVFTYGIVVDQLMYSEEIVVKPLGRSIKPLTEYSGATIMGNGLIALIVDVAGLAAKARLLSIPGKEHDQRKNDTVQSQKEAENIPFLAFHGGGAERYAIPLYTVVRIDTIRADGIERVGGWSSIPYGDRVLPVVSLSDLVQAQSHSPSQEAVIIVTEVRGREVGLLAAMPLEVIEMPADFDAAVLRQTGIAGSRVQKGATLLMVDLWEILQTTRPELLEFPEHHPLRQPNPPMVLLIEPQGYFRRQIRHYLEPAGYGVLEAPDEAAALQLLENPPGPIQFLLADFQLLSHDRFRLPRRLREHQKWATIPLVALSVYGREHDEALRKNGIHGFHIKLDHFGVLGCLAPAVPGLRTGAIPRHGNSLEVCS
jgi:two-component system chemotaxis sensor kinase CheA